MSHYFAWWIVEVSLLTVGPELSFLELKLSALVAVGTVAETHTS